MSIPNPHPNFCNSPLTPVVTKMSRLAIGGAPLFLPVTCKAKGGNLKGKGKGKGKGKTVKVVEGHESNNKHENYGGFGSDKKEPLWQCVKGCGACCKLAKGPTFATPEEIFDDPSDIQGIQGNDIKLLKYPHLGISPQVVVLKLWHARHGCMRGEYEKHYKSLIGEDGWCIHYDKSTRTCSIYDDRPYFCRVDPDVFEILYGINKRKFNKEACSCCKDTIKAIYGADSEVLDRFNKAIRS